MEFEEEFVPVVKDEPEEVLMDSLEMMDDAESDGEEDEEYNFSSSLRAGNFRPFISLWVIDIYVGSCPDAMAGAAPGRRKRLLRPGCARPAALRAVRSRPRHCIRARITGSSFEQAVWQT